MKLGNWATTADLNATYADLRAFNLERCVAEHDAFGFTVTRDCAKRFWMFMSGAAAGASIRTNWPPRTFTDQAKAQGRWLPTGSYLAKTLSLKKS
jgi:hypothetical protein